MEHAVRRIVVALSGVSLAGCALLVSFDGLDDGSPPDATTEPTNASDGSSPEGSTDASSDAVADSAADDGALSDGRGGDAGPLFLGCFADSVHRDLPTYAYGSPANTAAGCVTACAYRKFQYAGTQNGSQCFCGNAFGGQGPAGDCTMPCPGDDAEACGGNYENSVYLALGTAPDAAYIGCYADSMMRDLPYQAYGSQYNTVGSCAAACAYHGYRYAGLENGNQCFCGSAYGGQGPSVGCTDPCPGNDAEACGGYYVDSVYQTWTWDAAAD